MKQVKACVNFQIKKYLFQKEYVNISPDARSSCKYSDVGLGYFARCLKFLQNNGELIFRRMKALVNFQWSVCQESENEFVVNEDMCKSLKKVLIQILKECIKRRMKA